MRSKTGIWYIGLLIFSLFLVGCVTGCASLTPTQASLMRMGAMNAAFAKADYKPDVKAEGIEFCNNVLAAEDINLKDVLISEINDIKNPMMVINLKYLLSISGVNIDLPDLGGISAEGLRNVIEGLKDGFELARE